MGEILDFYSEDEIADLFSIKAQSVREKIKRDKEFENYYLKRDNKYFIKKVLIDEIITNRKMSVSTVEASKILGCDYSTILIMIKDKRVEGYIDKWIKKSRIFISSIEKYINIYNDYYTKKELSNILNIPVNSIDKRIRLNYSNIQGYIQYSYKGEILIKKDIISYLNYIEENYTVLKIIKIENNITKTELMRRIQIVKEDITIKNFFNGEVMLNNNYINYILNEKELIDNTVYLKGYKLVENLIQDLVMDVNKLLEFLDDNLKEEFYKSLKKSIGKNAIPEDLYNRIFKYINKITIDKNNDIYFEELLTFKDAANLFEVSEITMFRRFWKDTYNFRDYVEVIGGKKYIKMKYFDIVRNNIQNSKLTIDLAKELNVTNKYLEDSMYKIGNDLLIPDFFKSRNRILNRHIVEIKNYIKSNEGFDENDYEKLKVICLVYKLPQGDIRRIIKSNYKEKYKDIIKRNNNIYYIRKDFIEEIKSYLNNYLKSNNLVPENYEVLNDKLKKYDISKAEFKDIIKYNTDLNYDDLIIEVNKIIYISKEKWNSCVNYINKYDKDDLIYFDDMIHVCKATKILSMKLSELKLYANSLCNIKIDENILRNNHSLYFDKDFFENLEKMFDCIFKENYYKMDDFIDSLNMTKIFFIEILNKNEIDYRSHIKNYKLCEFIDKSFIKEITGIVKSDQKYRFDPYLNYMYIKHVLELLNQNIYDLSIIFKNKFGFDINNVIKGYNGFPIIPIQYYVSMKENKDIFYNYVFNRKDYYQLRSFLNINNLRLDSVKEMCKENNINLDKEIYFHENKKLISIKSCDLILSLFIRKQESMTTDRIDTNVYTISNQVMKKINISEYLINKLLSEDKEDNFVIYNNKIYIKNTYIDYMTLYFNNHIKLNDIAKDEKLRVGILKKACLKENIEIYNNIFSVTDLVIKKADKDKLINSKTVKKSIESIKIMELTKLANNEYELFSSLISGIETTHPKTRELFIKFFYSKLSDTQSRQSQRFGMARQYSNLYKYLNNILDNDIYNMTDNKISNILSTLTTKINTKVFVDFLSFCKSNIECNFKINYSIYNEKKDGYTEIYTIDEWTQITKFLVDIDKHLENSIESQKYANYWLLGLLHLILTFRLNDYITKMPNLYIEEVGITTFDWFKDENVFTLEMAQKLINQIKNNLEGNKADKNGEPLRFYYNIDFILPITISYTICELHRRKNKNKMIFELMISDKYEEIEMSPGGLQGFNRFFELNDIPILSNIKATSTLITQVYNYTNNKEGLKHVAILIGSSQRSHKIDNDIMIPRSTSIYIKPIYNHEDVKDIAVNIQKRGFFGWIPYMMLQIIDKEESLSNKELYEVTNHILDLKNKFSLLGIENLCEYIVSEHVNKKTEIFLNELRKMTRKDVKKRIVNAMRYSSSAKDKKCGCLAGQICKEKNNDKCKGCVYSLKNIYMIYELEIDIHHTIDKLEMCDLSDINNRIKYSHLFKNDMVIISEAKLFYDEYDPNFIEAFIDLDRLRDRSNKIKEKLML